jgi:hypothetical protein
VCEHAFVTAQGWAYHRFRRALDRGNVTEALSSVSELQHVGLAEALELTLLLRDKVPERFPRAALRWHGRYCREVDVSLEEAQAVLATLGALAGQRRCNAALALAELLSRRGLERACEVLVGWARGRGKGGRGAWGPTAAADVGAQSRVTGEFSPRPLRGPRQPVSKT